MPTRHPGQTPPDKANELFDKLLATSDNALKTRERLFADLKEELVLLASLQEQHLFPVLRKHEMQDLLQDATQDNEQTGALLAELERIPKNSSEFLAKLADLRKVFQQHIRNDKKELLPAVLKVLSEEETEAVVERIEDELTSFEEVKQIAAAPVQERAESARQVPDNVAGMMWSGTEGTQAVALSVQDISRECLHMSQKRLQTNLDGLGKMAQCRSVQDLVSVQMSLIQDNIEQTLLNTFRMADLAIQLAEKSTWTPMRQVERTAPHSRDFA